MRCKSQLTPELQPMCDSLAELCVFNSPAGFTSGPDSRRSTFCRPKAVALEEVGSLSGLHCRVLAWDVHFADYPSRTTQRGQVRRFFLTPVEFSSAEESE